MKSSRFWAKPNRQPTDAGFSLVELLVVVLIIGILSSIAIPVFLNQQNQAKDAAAKSDLTSAKVAMVSFSIDNNSSFANATVAGLHSFGYVSSPGVTLSVRTTATTFCIQANSASGSTFKITDSTGVAAGICP